MTGITAGVVVVILGIFIIPARKAAAKRKFDEKMQELRQRLHALMNEQFTKELNGMIQRIYDALAPYIRFVHAEQEKVAGMRQQLASMEAEVLENTITFRDGHSSKDELYTRRGGGEENSYIWIISRTPSLGGSFNNNSDAAAAFKSLKGKVENFGDIFPL